MQNSKSKYNMSLILFVSVCILSCTNLIEAFILCVIKPDDYYRYGHISLSLCRNYVGVYGGGEGLLGFVAFLIYSILLALHIAPILCGIIGSCKNNKKMVLISVIILDLITILAIFSRITMFGIDEYYDNVKFSPEMPLVIICVILLNVVVFTNKEFVIINSTQSTVADMNQSNLNGLTNVDTVEEIKKFKSLLDAEIITQEEFEMKKKQLL